jgi:FkbM family methyltransferase
MFINRIYNYEAHEVAPFILDCGGNIGLSTIWFKLRFPQAHVTVFEADPLIAEVLETNLKRLNLGDVEVVRAAAWVENGSVSFCSDGADQGRVTKDSNSQRVVAIRLADRIQQPVDLLKMDIEGSEYEVIGDLAESGKLAQIRRLICEVHGVHRNRYLVSDLLSSLAHFQHNITISTLPTTQSQRWAS